MTTAYIALGANLGNRGANLDAAVRALRATNGITITNVSSYMENPAVGGPKDSPAFLNAVVEVETDFSARQLLERLLEIEHELGRERREKWGPRIIDLDLVLFGDQVIAEPHLQVPHPLMHERRFVLAPLAEIAPDVVHPVLNRTAIELLDELDRRTVTPDQVVEQDIACLHCGYNLRGLGVQVNCPECGLPVEKTLDAIGQLTGFGFARSWRRHKTEPIAAQAGVTVDAVMFVLDALPLGQKNARDICNSVKKHAASYFNDANEAAELLSGWGIRSSEDVGRIIYAAVDAGVLKTGPADRIEDFNGLFRTETLFRQRREGEGFADAFAALGAVDAVRRGA